MRPQPLITVTDVEASSRWYQRLLGCESAHGLARADKLRAEIVLPRHRNPPSGEGGPNHWEVWLRDPDGYTVVLASPDGSATMAE